MAAFSERSLSLLATCDPRLRRLFDEVVKHFDCTILEGHRTAERQAELYAEGKTKAGVKPDPAEWRVARTIFVADDDKVAASYGRHDANSPYRFYYKQLQTKLTKAGRHAVFKERMDQPDSEITYDFVLDRLCMYGTVNKVVDQILALREQTGDFGELVYAGMDWVDEKLEKRSMQLMAEEVMPRVNAAIAKEGPRRATATR